MLTESDKAVLGESYRSARLGRETINTVIGKVEDEDLALDLNRQSCRYIQLEDRIVKEYQKEKEQPPQTDLMDRTRVWGAIQASTLLNSSTSRLADLVIQNNTKGIVELMRTVKAHKGVQSAYYEIAQEIMDFEEKNIEKLKAYLR